VSHQSFSPEVFAPDTPFFVLSTDIYADVTPALWANAHGSVNYTTFTASLVPSKTPSNFTFWSCDDAVFGENKGDSSVTIGYVVEDSLSLCLAVDKLEQNPYKGAHVQLAKCNIGDPHQNWQFSNNSFYSFNRLDFLGNTQGPYPPGSIGRPSTFPFLHSSPGYHLHNTSDSFNVHYDPSKYHGDNGTTFVFSSRFNSISA